MLQSFGLPPKSTGRRKVLHVGCGLSRLHSQLLCMPDVDVISIDSSPEVVRAVKGLNGEDTPVILADARDLNLTFPQSGSFDCVVDKGTLDALLLSEAGVEDAVLYGSEVWRLLRPGGRFVQMTDETPEARACGTFWFDMGMHGGEERFFSVPRSKAVEQCESASSESEYEYSMLDDDDDGRGCFYMFVVTKPLDTRGTVTA